MSGLRGNSAQLIDRLFRHAGVPTPSSTTLRILARCPRHRLVRAVAWYAHAWTARLAPSLLLPGLRYVARGWDDVYTSLTSPSGAVRADVEQPARGAALVIRPARIGRGWQKDPLPSLGHPRPEIELAVASLDAAVGCILHEDCATFPDLGRACWLANRE